MCELRKLPGATIAKLTSMKKLLAVSFTILVVFSLSSQSATAETSEIVLWKQEQPRKAEIRNGLAIHKPTTSDKRRFREFLSSQGFDIDAQRIACTLQTFEVSKGSTAKSKKAYDAAIRYRKGLNMRTANLINSYFKGLGKSPYDYGSSLAENVISGNKKTWARCKIENLN